LISIIMVYSKKSIIAAICGGAMFRITADLGWLSGFAILGATVINADCTLAQITPDATLPNNSIVTPDGSTLKINGGTQAGSNLFHSFSEFSIPTGGTAFFNNGADIQNIFSRVTGGSISNIDGLIRASGTANLFLINPNGIIFGSNARLDIGGSFLGTTASNLKFADGAEFSATASQSPPLLTVSVPIGLQYEGTIGDIHLQGIVSDYWWNGETPIDVKSGNTLAFVGGNVKLDGGFIQAPGGRIEIGGVAEAGTVGLNMERSDLRLSFSTLNEVALADVSLNNARVLVETNSGGGSIEINARNIDIQRSRLSAGTDVESFIARNENELGSAGTQTGDITLNSRGALAIKQSNLGDFFNNIRNINLMAGADVVFDATMVYGANVLVQASEDISLTTDETDDSYTTNISADNVRIQARSVSLTNESGVVANGLLTVKANSIHLNRGFLEGDDIRLQVRDLILMRNESSISNREYKNNGGNIRIDAPHGFIVASDNSDITANSFYGSGGQVTINALGIFGIGIRTRKDLERAAQQTVVVFNNDEYGIYPDLLTNDLTAVSVQNPYASGLINTNILGKNPSQDLVRLPINLVDASQQIDTGCTLGSRQTPSSFIITGRGGLPPSPLEMLTPDAVQVDWVTLNPNIDSSKSPLTATNPTTDVPKHIVEATGWVKNDKGEIVLTTDTSTTPHGSWQNPVFCKAS
jgi:filamentous hemagglutinin family protein